MSDEVEKHDNFPNKVEYTIQLGKSSITKNPLYDDIDPIGG